MLKRIKALIALVLIILLVLISIYSFIPNIFYIRGKESVHTIDQSLYTTLRKLKQTAEKKPDQLPELLKTTSFTITEISYPHFIIQSKVQEGKGILEIIPTQNIDSTILEWEWMISTGYNPISRLRIFFNTQQLKDSISQYTKNLAFYASQTENTYGLKIESANIQDTLIATVSNELISKPTTVMICELIERLQQELYKSALKNTGTIMLSHRYEGGRYIVMAGSPILERPPSPSTLKIKKINPSKLLFGIVQGGPSSIQQGYMNLKRYIMDRNIEEAAISYEIPLTNRCTEKDTSKWRTKICYPVY